MDKVSIVIVAYNRLDMLSECLGAVRRHTQYPYELILVDNGSDAPTADFIRAQKHLGDVYKIFRFHKNEGFARGFSKGLSLSNRKYRVILNSDTRPAWGWMGAMMTVANEHPDAGLILPYTNFACNPNIVCQPEAVPEAKALNPDEDVPAVCWMVSKPCYEAVCKVIHKIKGGRNFFHSDFEYGWAEDILTSQIVRKLGFGRYVAHGFIWHHGTATQKILRNAGNYQAANMQKLTKYLEMLKNV
jgi:glycosyltransferase involved in cell wall biosynthesis